MSKEKTQLPDEAAFLNPPSQDLGEHSALRTFLGKTAEQAEAMFRQCFLVYQEYLTYMRAPAFRFYVLPAMKYLLSEEANGDSDAASTFCYVLEARLRNDAAALKPIAAIVLQAIGEISANFERFDCSPEIYGDVPKRYRALAVQLAGNLDGDANGPKSV